MDDDAKLNVKCWRIQIIIISIIHGVGICSGEKGTIAPIRSKSKTSEARREQVDVCMDSRRRSYLAADYR